MDAYLSRPRADSSTHSSSKGGKNKRKSGGGGGTNGGQQRHNSRRPLQDASARLSNNHHGGIITPTTDTNIGNREHYYGAYTVLASVASDVESTPGDGSTVSRGDNSTVLTSFLASSGSARGGRGRAASSASVVSELSVGSGTSSRTGNTSTRRSRRRKEKGSSSTKKYGNNKGRSGGGSKSLIPLDDSADLSVDLLPSTEPPPAASTGNIGKKIGGRTKAAGGGSTPRGGGSHTTLMKTPSPSASVAELREYFEHIHPNANSTITTSAATSSTTNAMTTPSRTTSVKKHHEQRQSDKVGQDDDDTNKENDQPQARAPPTATAAGTTAAAAAGAGAGTVPLGDVLSKSTTNSSDVNVLHQKKPIHIHPTTKKYLETSKIKGRGSQQKQKEEEEEEQQAALVVTKEEEGQGKQQVKHDAHITESLTKLIDQAARIENEIIDEIRSIQTSLGVDENLMASPMKQRQRRPGFDDDATDCNVIGADDTIPAAKEEAAVAVPSSFECDRDAASLISELPLFENTASTSPVKVLATVTGRVVNLSLEEKDVEKVLDDVERHFASPGATSKSEGGANEIDGETKKSNSVGTAKMASVYLLITFCLSLAFAGSVVTLYPMDLSNVLIGSKSGLKFANSFVQKLPSLLSGTPPKSVEPTQSEEASIDDDAANEDGTVDDDGGKTNAVFAELEEKLIDDNSTEADRDDVAEVETALDEDESMEVRDSEVYAKSEEEPVPPRPAVSDDNSEVVPDHDEEVEPALDEDHDGPMESPDVDFWKQRMMRSPDPTSVEGSTAVLNYPLEERGLDFLNEPQGEDMSELIEQRGLDFLHEDDTVTAPRNVKEWVAVRRTGSACYKPDGITTPNMKAALHSGGCDVDLQDVLKVYNYVDASKSVVTSITRSLSETRFAAEAEEPSPQAESAEDADEIISTNPQWVPYRANGSRPAFLSSSNNASPATPQAGILNFACEFTKLTKLWDAHRYAKDSTTPGMIKDKTSRMLRSLVSVQIREQLSYAAQQPPSAKIELSVPKLALLFNE